MESDAKNKSTRPASTSIRFIEEYLAASPGRLVGLLLGQLDAFNRISTTFGYDEASAFCIRYAEQLRDSLPRQARIMRLSGRRFAVLLPLDSMAAVMDMALRLAEENPPHVRVGGDDLLVDVTLGIAVYPTHGHDAATLFRRAELALQEAKANELTFDIYRPDTTQQHAVLWKLESDLDKAIQQREIDVYFQPKLDLASGRIEGAEALARWRTSTGRFVPAETFIPIAERSASIVPLTWLVFDCVRRHSRSWSRLPQPFSVAVNVSPTVLAHPEFLDRLTKLKEALESRHIGLIVELTEDSLVRSEDVSAGGLQSLRKLGIGLALDDFGKGYSSLTYLREIPAAEVKIDRTFISAVALAHKDRHIVRTIVELTHALNMRVVAEGVDSQEGLDAVAELHCDSAQGFYIARPMRGDLLSVWIEKYAMSRRVTPAPSRVLLR
jgi:diguanylate cyclase (GGDEF)-like protein